MRFVATTSILVITALAVFASAAPGAPSPTSAGVTPDRHELAQRYPQTRGLAPSPEALAARAPDLVERYVTSHASTSSEPTRYIATYGLAPSPEALAARTTTSGGGFDWDGFAVIGGGVLFLALLLATGTTVALRHSRDRYAAV